MTPPLIFTRVNTCAIPACARYLATRALPLSYVCRLLLTMVYRLWTMDFFSVPRTGRLNGPHPPLKLWRTSPLTMIGKTTPATDTLARLRSLPPYARHKDRRGFGSQRPTLLYTNPAFCIIAGSKIFLPSMMNWLRIIFFSFTRSRRRNSSHSVMINRQCAPLAAS